MLLSGTREQVGVQRQDLGYLIPFQDYFISILLCFLLELKVTHARQFIIGPETGQVGLIHHVDVWMPEGFLSFKVLSQQKYSQRQLILIWVLLK